MKTDLGALREVQQKQREQKIEGMKLAEGRSDVVSVSGIFCVEILFPQQLILPVLAESPR